MRRISSLISAVALVSFLSAPAQANVEKTIITSATYGVLAGTIVGAATLAFAENPGDSLHRVARGASLGLYAGILLGVYVTYGIGDGSDEEEYEELVGSVRAPQFFVAPVLGEQGLEGASAVWNVASF